MNSGAAVLGMMVHRYRRLYFAFPAYLALIVVVAHLPKAWVPEPVAGILCMPFVLGLLATVFGFVNVEADIASPASACSPWLLRMPVKTTTLAFWPVAGAAAWASLSWIVFAALYLRPRGIDGPIWWPAVMFAALALNLQAILWTPVRRGSVRLLVALVMTMSIGLFGLIAVPSGWTAELVTEIYAVIGIGSALAAWYGLSRARTSTSLGIAKRSRSTEVVREVEISKPRKAFRSPQAAQFWLEWRRQGRLLPMVTALGLLAISLPLFFSRDNAYIQGSETIKVNIWMSTAIGMVPWIPLLFATVIGMGARPSDVRGTEGVYHLYHATRPLSAVDMYRAKILSITAGVLITAALTILTMLAWLWLPALSNDDSTTPYARIIFSSFHGQEWAILVGIGVTLIAWTWRNQAVGVFVDYLPSRRWASAYPYIVALTGTTIFTLFGAETQFLQSQESILVLSIIFGTLITAKLCLAGWFTMKLIAVRPSVSSSLIRAFGSWAAFATIAASTLGWIVYELPPKAIAASFQHPVPELLGILLVPLARPFGARMALEFGRHR